MLILGFQELIYPQRIFFIFNPQNQLITSIVPRTQFFIAEFL